MPREHLGEQQVRGAVHLPALQGALEPRDWALVPHAVGDQRSEQGEVRLGRVPSHRAGEIGADRADRLRRPRRPDLGPEVGPIGGDVVQAEGERRRRDRRAEHRDPGGGHPPVRQQPHRLRGLPRAVPPRVPPHGAEHGRRADADGGDFEPEVHHVLEGQGRDAAPPSRDERAAVDAEPPRRERPGERAQRRAGDRQPPLRGPLGHEVLRVGVEDGPGVRAVRREDALEGSAADAEEGVIAQQRLDPEDHLELGEVLVVELRPALGVAPEDGEDAPPRDREQQEPRRGALRGRPIALLAPGEEGQRDEPDREREHASARRRGDVDGDDQRDAEADGPPRDHGAVREQEAESGEGAEVEVPREVVRVEQGSEVPGDRLERRLVEPVDPGGPHEAVPQGRQRRGRRRAEHHDDAPRGPVPGSQEGRGREHRRVHRPLEGLDHRRPRIRARSKPSAGPPRRTEGGNGPRRRRWPARGSGASRWARAWPGAACTPRGDRRGAWGAAR